MSEHIIHIFISHSWNYHKHYETLWSWVFDESNAMGSARLRFQNYSVPKNDPIHTDGSDRELQDRIFARIARSHVIVIPMGMYTRYSKWIRKEINGANSYKKPILAIRPWAQERASSVVRDAADAVVGWNRGSLVREIWQLHRGNQQ